MSRLEKKNAIPVAEALMLFLKDSKLCSSHNTRRIFLAWDEASGAARYTLRKFFRDGKLYITLNSSVARGQLSMQKEAITQKINEILQNDELFIKSDPRTAEVKELILK